MTQASDFDKIYVNDLRDGDRVQSTFLVQYKAVPLNKNGKPYLAITLMDKTGTIDGRMWDNVEDARGRFEVYDFVEVRGTVLTFQGRQQVRLDSVRRVEGDDLNASDFLPATGADAERMLEQVRAIVASVEDEWVRKLLQAFLDDRDLMEKFSRAPAAKSIHHSTLGGLLEHTLSVMKLADFLGGYYRPRLNRNYLIAGAFLHDLGKIAELRSDRSFDYTDDGRLLGHIMICFEWIGQKAATIEGFPHEVERMVKHLVLTHHGSLEYGSPRRPQTIEATLVHLVDDLDSKVNHWLTTIDREGRGSWTNYLQQLDRHIYIGDGKYYDASAPEGHGQLENPTWQPGLGDASAIERTAPQPRDPSRDQRRDGSRERRPGGNFGGGNFAGGGSRGDRNDRGGGSGGDRNPRRGRDDRREPRRAGPGNAGPGGGAGGPATAGAQPPGASSPGTTPTGSTGANPSVPPGDRGDRPERSEPAKPLTYNPFAALAAPGDAAKS